MLKYKSKTIYIYIYIYICIYIYIYIIYIYIYINVFGYEDKTAHCIYTSKQTFEIHVDLSQLSNLKNSHYVLIKDFNRFMTNKTKYYDEKHFCQYCL